MHTVKQQGRIEVITGPMFAGKTEELIRRVRREAFAEKKIVVFKPSIDQRYALNEVVSHNNNRIQSISITSSQEIMAYVDQDVDVVAIDEVQFLDAGVVPIIQLLAERGIRVIVSGLDQDFRGLPFTFMPELLALAEEVVKLTAICVKCHAPATRTQRLVNGNPAFFEDPLILIGAKNDYEARCRHCHEVPHKK